MASSGLDDLYGAPKPAPVARLQAKRKTGSAPPTGGLSDLYGGGGAGLDAALPAPAVSALHLTRWAAPKLLDLVDRPRQTVQAGLAHGPRAAAEAFIHGQSREQQDANRALTRSLLHMPGAADRAQAHGLRGGVDDFALDTMSDPISYASAGVLPALKLVGRIGALGARAASRLSPEVAKDLTELAQRASDFMTYGGSAKRELGADVYHGALLADNRKAARAAEGTRRLTERFAAIKALPDADRLTVYQVLNGERDTRGLPPNLAAAVKDARALTQDAAALRATESGSRKLAYGGGHLNQADVRLRQRGPTPKPPDVRIGTGKREGEGVRGFDAALRAVEQAAESKGVITPRRSADTARRLVGRVDRQYDLPPELREFAAPTGQGALGAENIRARYLPAPHSGLAAGDRDAATFNELVPRDAHAMEREEFTVDPAQLAEHDAAFADMLRSAAHQGAAGRMREELGVRPGGNADPALVRLFEQSLPPTGSRRPLEQRLGDRWRGLVNIPKNTVTTLGLKHGLVNVPALAAQSEGLGAAGEALAGGTALARKSPADRWEALRTGIEGGVVTPFEDKHNPIVSFLEKIAPPVGKVSRAANDWTWAVDDAAKQAVFKRKYERLRGRGMSHQQAATRAGAETLREMVDYRHASQFTEGLRNVAPFATFRSRIPAAVASSAARDPRRLLMYDRATQGAFTGGKAGIPDERDPKRTFSMTTPTSDVLELGGEPWRYARGTLADPVKALLSAPAGAGGALGALTPKEQKLLRYFTYGQPLLPHRDQRTGHLKAGFLGSSAFGDVPFGLGEYGLGALGGSEFPAMDPLELLLGPTLGAHVR